MLIPFILIKINPPKAPRPIVKKIQLPAPLQQTNAPMLTISPNSQDPEPLKVSDVSITTKVQELGIYFLLFLPFPFLTFIFHSPKAPQERLSIAETVEEVDDVAWKEEVEENQDEWKEAELNTYAHGSVGNLETVTEENGSSSMTAVAL